MRRKDLVFLGLIIVLLAVAGWLGGRRGAGTGEAGTDAPRFPRDEAPAVKPDEQARLKVDAPPTRAGEGGGDGGEDAPKRALVLPSKLPPLPGGPADATTLRRALAAPGHGHLLINVSALTTSPIARRLIRCRGGKLLDSFDQLRQETGLDPQRDVDYLGAGLGSDVVAMSGRLGALKLPAGAVVVGKRGKIWPMSARERSGGAKGGAKASARYAGMLGDELLIIGDSEAKVRAALDRAAGRAPAEPSAAGNGDVQGQLLAADLARMWGAQRADGAPRQQPPMVALIQRLTERARLRMNVGADVAMSLDLDPTQDPEELAKAVRGGVSLMRQAARRGGRAHLEQLLDKARVLDADGGPVGLDLAVPGRWILARFGCDAEGNPLAAP